jgi:hypothetical protein
MMTIQIGSWGRDTHIPDAFKAQHYIERLADVPGLVAPAAQHS